jgi:small-conductance mechanosensitive channel
VRPAYLGPLLLVVLPLLGALVSGSGLGLVFFLACTAAALGAAWLSSPNGLWWIVPCTPTALLAVAFLWATFHGLSSAKTTVAAATNVFQDIAGAFPGIAAGTVAALIVTGVRVARDAAERRGTRG